MQLLRETLALAEVGAPQEVAVHVDAVEINPMIARIGQELYADYNGGLFLRNDVSLHLSEGRSYVRRTASDCIFLPAEASTGPTECSTVTRSCARARWPPARGSQPGRRGCW